MTRVALTVLLPLLAPTALYFLWYYAFGRKEETGSVRRPWTWLVLAGLAAAAIVLFTVGIGGGNRPGQYVPPHVEGGAVVPGQVVPPEQR